MTKSSSSLADYLRRPNPSVRSVQNAGTTTGTTTNYRWYFPQDIRIWEDFDLDAFNGFYERPLRLVLEKQYEFNDPPDVQEFPFCEIRDEDSLEALLIMSIQLRVSEALTVTQADLKAQASGHVIYMARGGHAVFDDLPHKQVSSIKKSKYKPFRPDWAGVRRPIDQKELGRNLLPGDSKLSKVFESKDIKTGDAAIYLSSKPKWYWVLSQIYTYCRKASAPYGYVITDKELVLVHLRPNDTNAARPTVSNRRSSRGAGLPQQQIVATPVLEYKAISWSHDQDSKDPSVALALWWLHMIAHAVAGNDHESQPEYNQEPLDSGSSPHGFDYQERRTPPATNIQRTDTDASLTSTIRHRLSGTALDGDDEGSGPAMGRGSKKRRRDDDSMEGRGGKSRKGK